MVTSTQLPARFRAHGEQSRLFEGPAVAVVAVSGGPDSTALLDLMASAAPAFGLTLVVAHADHGILSASATVAAEVRRLAHERYHLECVCAELLLGADASETRSRQARYAFLRQVQRDHGARYLVTAHHADDQVETVLLRLLRGSAPAGLAGIPERGPHGLVRPLLPFTRADLRQHLVAVGLAGFDDPSNADHRHARAWVRHALLPLLRQRLGAAADDALAGVAAHARIELDAWDQLLDELPALEPRAREGRADVARTPLVHYDDALAGRILRALARRAGLRLGPAAAARLVAYARTATGNGQLDLGEQLVGAVAFDRVLLSEAHAVPEPLRLETPAGQASFGEWDLEWRPEPAPERMERRGWTTWVRSTVGLSVRGLRRGDRLQPLGAAGHRPVRRLLMEAKVPRLARAGWPLVESAGDVLWVPGVCRADRDLPEPGTPAVRMNARTR